MPLRLVYLFVCFVCFVCFVAGNSAAVELSVLNPNTFSNYIARFNAMEDENVTNCISNAQSWNWLQKEIPFFECPDREVEEVYYFRWWSFRKHLEQTPDGFVFTEFLTRPVPVSSALGFHIAEGRWLHDQNYLNDYIRWWLRDPVRPGNCTNTAVGWTMRSGSVTSSPAIKNSSSRCWVI